MITEMLEALKGQDLNNTLIAGANVQEEVGLRGATSQPPSSTLNSFSQ